MLSIREAARAGQSEAGIVELAVRRLASPSVLDRLSTAPSWARKKRWSWQPRKSAPSEARAKPVDRLMVVLDTNLFISAGGPSAALLRAMRPTADLALRASPHRSVQLVFGRDASTNGPLVGTERTFLLLNGKLASSVKQLCTMYAQAPRRSSNKPQCRPSLG